VDISLRAGVQIFDSQPVQNWTSLGSRALAIWWEVVSREG